MHAQTSSEIRLVSTIGTAIIANPERRFVKYNCFLSTGSEWKKLTAAWRFR